MRTSYLHPIYFPLNKESRADPEEQGVKFVERFQTSLHPLAPPRIMKLATAAAAAATQEEEEPVGQGKMEKHLQPPHLP
jgi:hypothetical protein